MNTTKAVAGLVALVAISGCASFNTPMRNAEGLVVECRNSGWGWLGTPVAFAMQRQCESDARDKGFFAFNESAPPSVLINMAPPEGQKTQSLNESAPSQDGAPVSAEIERLHEMHKVGALTPEEFALAKQRLLSR